MGMFLPGLERKIGNLGNELGLGGKFATFMNYAEDPLRAYLMKDSGMSFSPWTHMKMDQQKDKEEEAQANQAFYQAFQGGE